MVWMSSGQNAPKAARKISLFSVVPRVRKSSGISAADGIGRRNSTGIRNGPEGELARSEDDPDRNRERRSRCRDREPSPSRSGRTRSRRPGCASSTRAPGTWSSSPGGPARRSGPTSRRTAKAPGTRRSTRRRGRSASSVRRRGSASLELPRPSVSSLRPQQTRGSPNTFPGAMYANRAVVRIENRPRRDRAVKLNFRLATPSYETRATPRSHARAMRRAPCWSHVRGR